MTPQPGDVLAIQSEASWFMRLIQAAERSQFSHTAIVSHTDDAGVLWCIEGRPGGIGWVRAERYRGRSLSNALQPKTADQRVQVAREARALLGTPYDWQMYADVVRDRLRKLWGRARQPQWAAGKDPDVLVCSSFADFVYERVGLTSPEADRYCTPADWASLWLRQDWASAY